MNGITDEDLMGFADGVLDEPRFSAIAAAVEADAALAARLEELVLGGNAAKALYSGLAEQPVPAHLQRGVERAIAAERSGDGTVVPLRRRWPRPAWPALAMAAAVAAVIAGPAGYLAGRSGEAAQLLAAGAPLSPLLAAQIDKLPSGSEAVLAGGTVLKPIATFTSETGALCREFELVATQVTVAVSCRASAEWRVALAFDAPIGDSGYAPAASLAVLDAYLVAIGAGPPLPLDQEADALAGR